MDASRDRESLKALLLGGLLILLVGAWFIYRTLHNAQAPETTAQATPGDNGSQSEGAPTIDAATIRQKVLNGETVTFLDLRSADSFAVEHIPHALSLTSAALGSFAPREKEVLVIVLSNKDTAGKETVTNILKQKSSSAFFLLDGGFEDWKAGGNQIISTGDPNSFLDQSKVTFISPADALKTISDPEANIYILDVQSEENFRQKHIKGAINIPLVELEKRSKEIPAARNIIVYGESELASFQGGVRLADLSFFSAKTLGGSDTLKPASGLPLEP